MKTVIRTVFLHISVALCFTLDNMMHCKLTGFIRIFLRTAERKS